MTAEEFKKRLDSHETLNLVDVRTPGEFEDFNFGGILLPMDELLLHIERIEHLKEEPVVLLCGVGMQSAIGVKVLAKKGFKDVQHVEGGLEAYLSL